MNPNVAALRELLQRLPSGADRLLHPDVVQELVRQVEAGEDPAQVLTRALEVSGNPNPVPGPPALGPADANDFASVREHGWAVMEKPKAPKKEYFFPSNDSFGERRSS